LSCMQDQATDPTSQLTLHDALPISPKAPAPARAPAWVRAVGDYFRGNTRAARRRQLSTVAAVGGGMLIWWLTGWVLAEVVAHGRSEEHTSELQSREKLVCRLLLENK